MVLAVWVYMASKVLLYTEPALVYMVLMKLEYNPSEVQECNLLLAWVYNLSEAQEYNPSEVRAYRALVLSVYTVLWAQDDKPYNPFGILAYRPYHIHMSDSSEYIYRSFLNALLYFCVAF